MLFYSASNIPVIPDSLLSNLIYDSTKHATFEKQSLKAIKEEALYGLQAFVTETSERHSCHYEL